MSPRQPADPVTPIPESECTFADAEVVPPVPDPLRALEAANAALATENARLKAALRDAEGKGGHGGGWVSISRVKAPTSTDCERTTWPLPADIDQYSVRLALRG